MIPNNRSLVPVNEYQQAAIHAVVLVERKKEQGKRLAEFPYAKAFFRVLNNGRGQILANDIRLLSSNYSPDERGRASIAQYIKALDRLIESGGQYSPLPLSGDVVATLFPAYVELCHERRERKWDMQYERRERKRNRKSAGAIRPCWRRPKLSWHLPPRRRLGRGTRTGVNKIFTKTILARDFLLGSSGFRALRPVNFRTTRTTLFGL